MTNNPDIFDCVFLSTGNKNDNEKETNSNNNDMKISLVDDSMFSEVTTTTTSSNHYSNTEEDRYDISHKIKSKSKSQKQQQMSSYKATTTGTMKTLIPGLKIIPKTTA